MFCSHWHNMGHLTIVAFVAVLANTVSAVDLYANRITGSDTSRGRQYTVTYTSSEPALVLWGTGTPQRYFNDTIYSNGQGESTITKPEATGGVLCALLLNETFIYYFVDDFVGEKELPEVELESLNGDVVDYTQNVPLSYGMKYSNLPSGYSSGQLSYYFRHINSRDNPVLKTAMSYDPSHTAAFTNLETNVTTDYTIMTVDINMESMEGFGLVLVYYQGDDLNMAIAKGTTVVVKQAQHESPFPDGFIALSFSNTGDDKPYCRDSICLFNCDAFGSDIVDVHVRRKSNGEVIEPLFDLKMNKWYVTTGYQRPVEDYGQTFVCSATNAQGQTVERDIVMKSEK